MSGGVSGGVRTRPWTALIWGLIGCIVAPAALAADCPGHPDALGTSRTLVVDPREHRLLGTMQYRETLPLADHEVVLTFDDGPLPRNSNRILDILASQCVKATFFEIGRMAQASPEGVRKLRDAGHTIGTHTEDHPLSMNRMSIERARQEIDEGIASVKAALGDDADTALAPFFRIPGLARADAVEDYLGAQGIQIWSADFPADDWRHVPSSRVYDLAMSRLEAKGKGILLLHDIQARTVAALPRILNELKARGYRIVHVVPATPERPATPTEPEQWRLHPAPDAIAHWPKIPNFVFADTSTLPAPSVSDFAWPGVEPIALVEPFDRTGWPAPGVPLPREAPWPRLSELPPENTAAALPAPAQSIFEMPEGLRVALHSVTPSLHHAEQAGPGGHQASKPVSADTADSRRVTRGKRRLAHGLERSRRHGTPKVAGHATTPAAAATHRGPLKRLVQIKKRNV
ncbi:MAG: polysaccharide deacetylase family protein [Bradyrhizobium sp.]|uniref:polysaccharide deacetylase family protein n=1 Tax=Bradyrhizobium sp. TaxID=376 RepID=UPI001215D5CB|nr:polysaccharide deacetylase family protein [Bradyrhizobium sp.]THD48056.1 MAG: polysaccharide deacetylase family protein [Bradyrhizobium sp.]